MNFDALRNYMDILTEKYNTPGVDCIVYKNHEMLFRYYTGMSDIENQKPMTGNEIYLIFSMTKMITCTAALQLFEQGKYIMSDPVSRYIPEFEKMKVAHESLDASAAAKITTGKTAGDNTQVKGDGYAKNQILIRDLFTMCSGLDYALNDEAISNAKKQGKKTTRELVGAMADKTLLFEPGTRYNYSLSHDVLGALVEIWSGMKFSEYLSKNIFEPLGMKDTSFGVPKDSEGLSRMMTRYRFDENRSPVRMPLECAYNLTDEYESGGAGLSSTTEDYALLLDALSCGGMGKSGKRILSSSTVKLMGTNHLKGIPADDFNLLRQGYGYGLGVRTHIDNSKSGSLSPHGEFGWDGAAGSFSMVDPVNNLSLTYFQHIHNWDIRIQTEMRNILYTCLD